MNFFKVLFSNSIINLSLLSFFIAQALKVIIVLLTQKKVDVSRFIGSGGMPSSHAAFTTALTVAVGRTEGFTSTLFAITFAFTMVVMYDASGVRRAAGQQARILNKMLEHWNDNDNSFMEKKLKELLGHTPFEVLVGAILGVFIATVFPL